MIQVYKLGTDESISYILLVSGSFGYYFVLDNLKLYTKKGANAKSERYLGPSLKAINYFRKKFRERRGVVVIATAQLHSTKPELRFCAGSNPARGVSEIRDGEDL